MIPKIIHQTWKTEDIPKKWQVFADKVKALNPDWEYTLWTDQRNDEFVKSEYPDFYNIFTGFSRGVMRADVIRYLIMYKIGGVYLDLDYEMLKPFDFGSEKIILPRNRSINFGDKQDELGNCIFASQPGHLFWLDVINDLKNNPPNVTDYSQIVGATGPGLLTRIFRENKYNDITTPDRILYHPPSPRSNKDINKIKNNGISLGIHHSWGSWQERWSKAYLKYKINKIGKKYFKLKKEIV